MKQTPIDENTLVMNLKAQNQRSFTILYKNYAKAIKNNISKFINSELDLEHILQETFIKIWQNIDKYDPSKGRLYAWMIQISRNTAIDFLRMRSNQYQYNEVSIDSFTDYFVYESSSHDYIGFNQIINQLEPKQKQVIDLYYFMGYTHKQAAKQLNIPEGTVKTRIHKALKQLEEFFRTDGLG